MEKCKCTEPANDDKVITFCGRCDGVVDEGNNELEYLMPKSFDEAVRPLMRWMAENNHPHTWAIVDSTTAVLTEGVKSYNTDDFIVD